MIPFDKALLTVEHVYLKACTTALGGSISVLDESRSTDEKEVFKKVNMPMAVARKFIQVHDVSRYIKPVLCAVAFYDGHAVALERHPLGNNGEEETEGLFGKKIWESTIESKIISELTDVVSTGQWFTDGVFVYNFTPATTANAITNMSSDSKFKAVPVDAIRFTDLANVDSAELNIHRRACLDFTSADGTRATSPPIWKQLTTIGDRQMERHSDSSKSKDDEEVFQFDRIDEFLAVNLGFALKAAKELSDVFGYDAMEPLALDELMIQLRTVNLPKVSKHIKSTFDTGMKFTHAVAWLVGLNSKVDTLESYKVLRSLLKYLTTKGVYHKASLAAAAVYHPDMCSDDIPLMTMEEAGHVDDAEIGTAGVFVPPSSAVGTHTAIGTLYSAE